MRSRFVRIWTRWQQDRAQRGADRIAAKNDVLKQMNHWLLELAAGHAVGPAEDIQEKADTLWRPRSNRQTRRLQSYFLRILPNLSQAQRQAIQETLRQVTGASAIKTALTAALQSPAASLPRRSIPARHKLADGARGLRSSMAVKVTTSLTARHSATQREAARQLMTLLSALRTGQPARATALLNKTLALLRTLGGPYDDALQERFHTLVTATLEHVPLAELEAISACSPKPGEAQAYRDVLARGIADALFLKRLSETSLIHDADEVARMLEAASPAAIAALARLADPTPAQAHALQHARSLADAHDRDIANGLSRGLKALAAGSLNQMLDAYLRATLFPQPAPSVSARRDLLETYRSHILGNLTPRLQKSLAEWFAGPRYDALMDCVTFLPQLQTMLELTKEVLFHPRDAKHGPGGPPALAAEELSAYRITISEALIALGYSGGVPTGDAAADVPQGRPEGVAGPLIAAAARGGASFGNTLAEQVASIGATRHGASDQAPRAEFLRLLAAEVVKLPPADAAKFFLDLIACKAELRPRGAEALAELDLVLGVVMPTISRGSPADRLGAAFAALSAQEREVLGYAINRARQQLDDGGERPAVRRLVQRIETALAPTVTLADLVRANMNAQAAMKLEAGNTERITVQYDGMTRTVPVFAELHRDIVRARFTIATADGQVKPLIDPSDADRMLDQQFKAQAQAKALQAIFSRVAGGDREFLQHISLWAQQGVWGFLDKAAFTRNSPFKLRDGTPVCLPVKTYQQNYHLARQMNGDVILRCTITYKPRSIALYYQNDRPDLARTATPASECGAIQVLRIRRDGRVSLEEPVTTWSKLALAAE